MRGARELSIVSQTWAEGGRGRGCHYSQCLVIPIAVMSSAQMAAMITLVNLKHVSIDLERRNTWQYHCSSEVKG